MIFSSSGQVRGNALYKRFPADLDLFHHTALSLQVVVEDHVQSAIRGAYKGHLGYFALAIVGIIAVLDIVFPGG